MSRHPILQVSGLSYFVGKKALIEDIHLDLREGEFHVILGRNGAGKSTLLRQVTGELPPSAGSIKLWGRPLGHFKTKELARRRAVLAQHTALNFDYRVLEVALLGRLPHQKNQVETEEDIAVARAALRQVGLDGYEDRSYLTLSGGEQQRTHLARVLAQIHGNAPQRLLFLDEPTSSLDLHHQHQVLGIARQLTAQGVGVFAIVHDLNLAARYADRITILSHGKVAATGTPGEVFQESILFDAFQQPLMVTRHPCFDCPLVVTR